MKGITVKKEDNFSEWFTQLMQKAELADHSAVSGCMVFRPYSYAIWEKIANSCDKEFKKLGVKNAYFPLFIPENLLKKQADHIEDFAPEVAWVDYGGNTKLGERLAVRPTSEAIMYDSYSKWIRSWRDLPLLINQWNNVVRWEFKNPVPFFRTREFLWNEMHTVFASEKEALAHGEKVMKAYNKVTEGLLALPGFYGKKTDKEKFAGAIFSAKIHHYMSNGRIIEGTCFHYDGQNFAKSYDIKFLDEKGKRHYAYQNTHAITTRYIGAMLAIHSDDKGLVLPPKIAPNRVVIVPLLFKKDPNQKKVLKKAENLAKKLKKHDVILDTRENYSSGWKFNEWELKGIPIRIEIGPRDLEKRQVMVYRRDLCKKEAISSRSVEKYIENALKEMQKNLFAKAEKSLKENIIEVKDFKSLEKGIKNKKMVLAPLCSNEECEDWIKDKTTGGKSICIAEKKIKSSDKCVYCGEKAKYFVYFGKTY